MKFLKYSFILYPKQEKEVLAILHTVIYMCGKENNEVISCMLGRTPGKNLTFTLILSLLTFVCSGKSLLAIRGICSAAQ